MYIIEVHNRKVNASGRRSNPSMVIVLPKRWCKSNSIGDSSTVKVIETQEALIVPRDKKSGREILKALGVKTEWRDENGWP